MGGKFGHYKFCAFVGKGLDYCSVFVAKRLRSRSNYVSMSSDKPVSLVGKEIHPTSNFHTYLIPSLEMLLRFKYTKNI